MDKTGASFTSPGEVNLGGGEDAADTLFCRGVGEAVEAVEEVDEVDDVEEVDEVEESDSSPLELGSLLVLSEETVCEPGGGRAEPNSG